MHGLPDQNGRAALQAMAEEQKSSYQRKLHITKYQLPGGPVVFIIALVPGEFWRYSAFFLGSKCYPFYKGW
jgi:hypothetical protein